MPRDETLAAIRASHQRMLKRGHKFEYIPYWRTRMRDFILCWQQEHDGRSPSVSTIARHFGKNHKWATDRVKELETLGVIEREGRKIKVIMKEVAQRDLQIA